MEPIVGAAFAIGTALFVSYFFLRDELKTFLVVSLWSIFWICLAFGLLAIILEDGQRYGPITAALDLILFIGMGFLGAGWFKYSKPIGHRLVMVGWQLFGLYWLFQIPMHFANDDPINLMFLGGGIAFFSVLGYHEHLSIRWNEQHRGLKFMTGATFVTGFIYFILAKDPALVYFFTGGDLEAVMRYSLGYKLIYMVANQSAELANFLFNYNTFPFGLEFSPLEGISVPIENTGSDTIGGISLILACTGIEAMAMFFGAIVSVRYEKDPWASFRKVPKRAKWYKRIGARRRAILAFMVTIPVIYVLNLVRNAYIIHFIRQSTFTQLADRLGMDEFTLLHGVLFKIFAFVILIVLAIAIFDIIPELHSSIMKLFELPTRNAPEPVLEARRKKAKEERNRMREEEERKKGKGQKKTDDDAEE
jgi:exosortase/archaeosortase family protein